MQEKPLKQSEPTTKPQAKRHVATQAFPKCTISDATRIPDAIRNENAGQPLSRVLLAKALDMSPSSSAFRTLLNSANKYGLIEGNEKSDAVALTDAGRTIAYTKSDEERARLLLEAVMHVDLFRSVLERYNSNRVPSMALFCSILHKDFSVPEPDTKRCVDILLANAGALGVLENIKGSQYVTLSRVSLASVLPEQAAAGVTAEDTETTQDPGAGAEPLPSSPPGPKPIFIGHGKQRGPVDSLVKILDTFKVPYKLAVREANLGRPISKKVRDTMLQCGSAILILTKDEEFTDSRKGPVWRPSENVVHEVGAASFAYDGRIVIMKEKGLDLPTNFSDIGYIEFEAELVEAKTTDIFKELIGFGLLKVTPA